MFLEGKAELSVDEITGALPLPVDRSTGRSLADGMTFVILRIEEGGKPECCVFLD
jgi:hypothetical protein